MKEILYLEIPTPDTSKVLQWLHQEWKPSIGDKKIATNGIRIQFSQKDSELSIFIWSLQRTTYLKVFQWGKKAIGNWSKIKQQLITELNDRFPQQYPSLPEIDLKDRSIF